MIFSFFYQAVVLSINGLKNPNWFIIVCAVIFALLFAIGTLGNMLKLAGGLAKLVAFIFSLAIMATGFVAFLVFILSCSERDIASKINAFADISRFNVEVVIVAGIFAVVLIVTSKVFDFKRNTSFMSMSAPLFAVVMAFVTMKLGYDGFSFGFVLFGKRLGFWFLSLYYSTIINMLISIFQTFVYIDFIRFSRRNQ